MFRSPSRREKIFRKALARDSARTHPAMTRGRTTQKTAFPWGLFSLWTTFVLAGTYILVLGPLPMVTEVRIKGADRVSGVEIQALAERVLDEREWQFISRRNYFLVPKQRLIHTILAAHPLLRSVEVRRIFPSTLLLQVEERPWLSVWCSGGPCYVLGADTRAESNEESVSTAYAAWRLAIIDTSALPVTVHEELPVKEYLDYFEALYTNWPDAAHTPLKREAFTPSRFSRELRLETQAGWDLLVSLDMPIGDMLSALKALLDKRQSLDTSSVFPLASIDVRVPGKIFFSEIKPAAQEADAVQEMATPNQEKPASKKKKREQAL